MVAGTCERIFRNFWLGRFSTSYCKIENRNDLQCSAVNGGIVMMARIAVMQALHGRKAATPELASSMARSFLPEGRADAAAIPILCDITR